MSVSFAPSPTPTPTTAELMFWCSAYPAEVPVSEAEQAAAEHAAACTVCRSHGSPLVGPIMPYPQLNLANGNAAAVLISLGFAGYDLVVGSCDAEDLRIRIDAALADLAGTDDPDRMYVRDRLVPLAELVDWAVENGAKVCWG